MLFDGMDDIYYKDYKDGIYPSIFFFSKSSALSNEFLITN